MLDEKWVVLTGGAGGIARETTPLLLAQGARVLLIDVDGGGLAEIAEAHSIGDRLLTHVSDLATPAACATALDLAGGPIHSLVHLAGLFEPDALEPEDHNTWDRAIAANLTNGYDMAVAFRTRHVQTEPARLIFISSLAFNRGAPEYAAYSAAKGGLVGLVRALSRRLAPDVLVNGLAPGIITTTMPDRVISLRRDKLLGEIPLGRFGHPREVATVIEFLCGPGASYINGQIINIDGGTIN